MSIWDDVITGAEEELYATVVVEVDGETDSYQGEVDYVGEDRVEVRVEDDSQYRWLSMYADDEYRRGVRGVLEERRNAEYPKDRTVVDVTFWE
jgi:hypothetical protein